MNFGLAFAPLVSIQILLAAVAVVAVLALLLFVSRTRGALMRAAGLALLVLALANPSFTREDRDPLSSVAVVVVDKSPSQSFGERERQTEEARKAVVERLDRSILSESQDTRKNVMAFSTPTFSFMSRISFLPSN